MTKDEAIAWAVAFLKTEVIMWGPSDIAIAQRTVAAMEALTGEPWRVFTTNGSEYKPYGLPNDGIVRHWTIPGGPVPSFTHPHTT